MPAKYVEAPEGHEIQVGDIIHCDTGLNEWHRVVKRVTKRYAIVDVNERCEARYRRTSGFGFGPIPYVKWSTNRYKVYLKP